MTEKRAALAKAVMERALRSGADQAEVFLQVGRSADVRVRDGEIEDLTQATSKGLGLRVFVKNRLGFVWTSDFSESALDAIVSRAVSLAEVSADNPDNGLPDPTSLGKLPDVGPLFDQRVADLPPDWKIKASIEMEKVIKSFDPRIKTIDSVGAGESVSEVYLASSAGMHGSYEGTSVYLYASPVATDGTQLQTSYWYDAKRFFEDLLSPEEVAKKAAARAVRLLGAKKIKTQKLPVVFDPTMAAGFVSSIAGAMNGDAVFKRASFLASKLGQKIAPDHFTLVDDGLWARGLATSPFDGEGVPTRTTPLVEKGVLKAFLYDSFTARKAKTKTTGNASRGYRSLPGIGVNNLTLTPGTKSPEEILKEIPRGLYVTAMLGHGANTITGDYSRGANGLLIENGELTQAVQEVTVGGNLNDMLMQLDAIGNDLHFHGATGASTIRFKELTVSGE
ncbi:MAG: TldD/PmbA family protein [Archangium sp.]|nr:TldD/PmbA family protein [Archangium sp.]